jgi:hypothetical protein
MRRVAFLLGLLGYDSVHTLIILDEEETAWKRRRSL